MPSLAIPDPSHLPPWMRLAQVEAVRLFVERAGKLSAGFRLTASECRRGRADLPAAGRHPHWRSSWQPARARMMTVEQIAARLGDTFHLLTGGSRAVLPRQQTLKAIIDWSYDQLSPRSACCCSACRSSPEAGRWKQPKRCVRTRSEAQLCQEERVSSPEVMDLLAQLVDKSLIQTGSSAAGLNTLPPAGDHPAVCA